MGVILKRIKYYDPINRRLIYVGNKATPDYWDERWITGDNIREEILKSNKTFVSQITNKYLSSKDGMILEGGCGKGRHVAALVNNGYFCIGVDYAVKTVNVINEICPELNIIVADVHMLPFPNELFIGYWSLGVIEHFWEGFDLILMEMSRVTRHGGYLFVTFPYMSPLRRFKARIGFYALWKKEQAPYNFYQFALDPKFVSRIFKNYEFKLIKTIPFDTVNGVLDEIPIINRLLRNLIQYNGNNILLKLIRKFIYIIITMIMFPISAHCLLLIFKKTSCNGKT